MRNVIIADMNRRMTNAAIRLAVRAIIIKENRLLLVNAYGPNVDSDLWCAPGGGAEMHSSLPANLAREVYEETGLTVRVGRLAMINEFHAAGRPFHQVEMFFRCQIISGGLDEGWQDPEHIVNTRRFFSPAELAQIHLRPHSLARIAFDPHAPVVYDPLEELVPPKRPVKID